MTVQKKCWIEEQFKKELFDLPAKQIHQMYFSRIYFA
jgi:hypothetical protein